MVRLFVNLILGRRLIVDEELCSSRLGEDWRGGGRLSKSVDFEVGGFIDSVSL